MPSAAGILFVHDGHVLLLKRTGSPHAGTWAFPGGGIEDGETPEQAARRETKEECGYTYDGPLAPLWTTADGFQCFGAVAADQWKPRLNDEHSAARWAPFDDLPTPLHPSLGEGAANMPLINSATTGARSQNIAKEIDAGKDPKQAAAIAYRVQRKAEHANDAAIKSAFDSLAKLAEDCMLR